MGIFSIPFYLSLAIHSFDSRSSSAITEKIAKREPAFPLQPETLDLKIQRKQIGERKGLSFVTLSAQL